MQELSTGTLASVGMYAAPGTTGVDRQRALVTIYALILNELCENPISQWEPCDVVAAMQRYLTNNTISRD